MCREMKDWTSVLILLEILFWISRSHRCILILHINENTRCLFLCQWKSSLGLTNGPVVSIWKLHNILKQLMRYNLLWGRIWLMVYYLPQPHLLWYSRNKCSSLDSAKCALSKSFVTYNKFQYMWIKCCL